MTRKVVVRKSLLLSLSGLFLSILTPRTSVAEPGDFWYGFYYVFTSGLWSDTVYDVLSDQYKVNWIMGPINDQTGLDNVAQTPIKVMQRPEPPGGPGTVQRFSGASYLKLQAEGDLFAGQWEPGSALETMVRHSGGSPVYDGAASNDTAWYFNPGVDSAMSEVYEEHFYLRNRDSSNVDFSFQIRGTPHAGSDTIVAYYGIRNRVTGEIRRIDSIALSQVTSSYGIWYSDPYLVADRNGAENYNTEMFVTWTGVEELWVDWLRESDEDGVLVVEDPATQNTVKDFVSTYTFNDSSTIIGFWLEEELANDGNILPQFVVDTLVRKENPRLVTFTEHHYLYRWSSSFGGRSALTARLQHEQWPDETYMTTISYPMTGYKPDEVVLGSAGPDTITLRACVANPPGNCQSVTSDTSICFQAQMDKAGHDLRFYKEFSDSLEILFYPWLQAWSSQSRSVPDSCGDGTDTTWYGDVRRPTDKETRCHAGVALANGANGLLYAAYTGNIFYTQIDDCQGGTRSYAYSEKTGMTLLPDVQSALRNFVGPFVDSLGHYFADFQWLGGGRLDELGYPAGLGSLFDSTARSLTFTEAGDSAYIEAGVYTLPGETNTDYFLLVNRRAYDTIPQEVLVWLDPTSQVPLFDVTDLYSQEKTLIGRMGSTDSPAPFRTSIPPGEARLFKVFPRLYSSVSGSTASYPPVWSGKIAVSGDVTVASGHPLTVYGPAELRIADGENYSIDVEDDLTIAGTTTDSVIIMSAAGSPADGDWYGILHEGPGDLSIEHTTIKHAYRAISIDDTSDVISASIRSCNIEDHTLSGLYVKTNPSSTIEVANTSFNDAGFYGVQVYEGFVTIDSCTFSGGMRDGIRVQGTAQDSVVGGQIRGNRFEGMTYAYVKGIYLYGITDDGLDWSTEPVMQDNIFAEDQTAHPGQVAYVIYNCDDTLSLLRNAVDCANNEIGYGILTYATRVFITGDVDSVESKSRIRGPHYGVYIYTNSSSMPYPVIRQMSLEGYWPLSYGYSVWISNLGRADLGRSDDYGYNVLFGDENSKAAGAVYAVYALNGNYPVYAEGNYWPVDDYTYGPVDKDNSLQSNPFPGGAGKLAADIIESPIPDKNDLDVLQAYPNPFNAAATIRFNLSTPQEVDVTIYNILGQRVRTLWSGVKEAGEHFLEWDGRDGTGQVLASGVYLYRVTTETKQIAKSIVLVK